MIAALLSALLSLSSLAPLQAPLQAPTAPPIPSPSGAADGSLDRAEWRCEAREREVGEAFEATLVVRHGGDEHVEVDGTSLEGDTSWLSLDAPRLRASRESGEGRTTSIDWTLASLEPGERELPTPGVSIVGPNGAHRPVTFAPRSARFVGVLLEGEDEPRAPLGFRPLEPLESASNSQALLLGGVLALVALGAAAWALLRRRSRAPVVTPRTALEELAELDTRDLESREGVREAYYQLTSLLRREVDARSRTQRSALTDLEWASAVSGELSAENARELQTLLRDAEGVKYGAHHPTHWAARESFAKARRILESVGATGASQELAA